MKIRVVKMNIRMPRTSTHVLDIHAVIRVEVNYLRPIYGTALTSLLSVLPVVLSVHNYFVPCGSRWRDSHARLRHAYPP